MPKVITERRGRTFVVTINRPEVRNCVDGETAQGLSDAVDMFRADADLDVFVLTGAGDVSFCSGRECFPSTHQTDGNPCWTHRLPPTAWI